MGIFVLNDDPNLFAKNGYCVFPRVFSHAEVESNRRLLDEATDKGMLDRDNYLGEPHTRDERWLEICRHPKLLDAVQSVLGLRFNLGLLQCFHQAATQLGNRSLAPGQHLLAECSRH